MNDKQRHKIVMATNVRKFLLKKFPPSKDFDYPVSKERQELMQEYADQETKELKDRLERTQKAYDQRKSAFKRVLVEKETIEGQLTEANALIEKMALKMKEASDYLYEVSYVNGELKYLNSIGSQSKLHDSFLYLYNEYKTKQTAQEVKP